MIKYENNYQIPYDELTKMEQKIYDKQIIKKEHFLHSELDIKEIKSREVDYIIDKIYNLPQTIFYIKFNKIFILGRKIRSQLSIENKINAINCSQITASMILGILKSKKLTGKDVFVEYYPMAEDERLSTFDKIKSDSQLEIIYPFQERLYGTNQVEKTGKEGWSLNPNKVIYLGYGEEHLREYTKSFIKPYIKNGLKIYDPACSTGQFLYELKKAYPVVTILGGDLSKQMTDYASQFLDYCECCNAKDSKLEENSIDIMFLRFLNDQVVSKYQAKQFLPKTLTKVKKGGLVIAFGHTPVLLTKKQFEHYGLKVESCIGYYQKNNCIFQYYVVRKL